MRSLKLVLPLACLCAAGAVAMELPAPLAGNGLEELPPSLTYSAAEHDWLAIRAQAMAEDSTFGDRDNQPPYVMLGGYFDTEVTFQDGGTVNLIAYVMDPDGYSDIARVEIYFAGQGTGVLLQDDGAHGDFSAGDQVFGFTVPVGPEILPAGNYTLEIQAVDQQGNRSDLWPYLTVHP